KKDGWYLQSTIGSHYHYVHDSKKGKVTIPFHGNKELSKYVVNSILKQAGLKE
ncbi:MAG: type II toxin-antitoxin system HicA family toxin, partial [Treponema sp.]